MMQTRKFNDRAKTQPLFPKNQAKLKQKLKTQGQKLENFQKLNFPEILFAADAGKSAKK